MIYSSISTTSSQASGCCGCPASRTFPAVERFIQSGQAEALLTLTSPKTEPIRLRAIRLVSPDGECSVLLTNLLDAARFPAQAVIDLY